MTPTSGNPASQIDLRLVDQVVTISVTINWTDEVYGQFVFPRLLGLSNQLKGKTTVYAGSNSWIGLGNAVEAYVKQLNRYFRGDYDILDYEELEHLDDCSAQATPGKSIYYHVYSI